MHDLWDVQARVLDDVRVSDAAKFLFCKLMCQDGFRAGWIYSNLKWTLSDCRSLHEIERAGHIILSEDDGFGARLVQFQGNSE